VSKTHWATCRHQSSLLTASCCATSQVMPMLFKSCCKVSIQFFRGLPGFLFEPLISQCSACLGSLLSIRRTCPSHLSLLTLHGDHCPYKIKFPDFSSGAGNISSIQSFDGNQFFHINYNRPATLYHYFSSNG